VTRRLFNKVNLEREETSKASVVQSPSGALMVPSIPNFLAFSFPSLPFFKFHLRALQLPSGFFSPQPWPFSYSQTISAISQDSQCSPLAHISNSIYLYTGLVEELEQRLYISALQRSKLLCTLSAYTRVWVKCFWFCRLLGWISLPHLLLCLLWKSRCVRLEASFVWTSHGPCLYVQACINNGDKKFIVLIPNY
jgi:hypothetical protein